MVHGWNHCIVYIPTFKPTHFPDSYSDHVLQYLYGWSVAGEDSVHLTGFPGFPEHLVKTHDNSVVLAHMWQRWLLELAHTTQGNYLLVSSVWGKWWRSLIQSNVNLSHLGQGHFWCRGHKIKTEASLKHFWLWTSKWCYNFLHVQTMTNQKQCAVWWKFKNVFLRSVKSENDEATWTTEKGQSKMLIFSTLCSGELGIQTPSLHRTHLTSYNLPFS